MQSALDQLFNQKDPDPASSLPIGMSAMTNVQAEGDPEHAKRLKTYAKTTILITFNLFVAFYTTKLHQQENKIFILASFTSLLLALLTVLALVVLIGCVEYPNGNCFRCRFEERMYIVIYGSNSLMMITAFFLLLICTFRYIYLSVFLVLALFVIIILLYQGSKLKHTVFIKKYREHDSELNRFSELSSAVGLMLITGLSTIVFSSPALSGNNHQIKVTECFLYVILVMSLLVMLLTSVPPAVRLPSTRARMVVVVKSLSYTLVSFLTLVGLMAASEILQGLVVFSTFPHIIGATCWLVSQLLWEPADQGRVEPVSPMELDSLSMVIATGAFSALMYVYSLHANNSEPYSQWYYFLLALCMISLCSTFISSLSKLVIFSYSVKTQPWIKAHEILSCITYISLFVALLSTFLLAVYST